MLKTILMILTAVNITAANIRFIKNDDGAACLDLADASLDILVIDLVDVFYYHTYYKVFGFTSIWINIALLVIAILCFIYTFMRSQGWILNVVAYDENGEVVKDENGVPLTGRAARKAVKEAKNAPPAMTIKIDGEVNKEASDAATKYIREHWVEDNKFKTKDDDGNSISKEDILKDVRKYIFEEWAPANGYVEEEEDPLESLLNKTTLDCVKNLEARDMAEFMQEIVKHGCEGCEDFEKCQALSDEEREAAEIQCIVDLLNSKIFKAAAPEEILEEAEEPSEEDS